MADAGLDFPRRHEAAARDLRDLRRAAADFVVGRERKWSGAAGAMAGDTRIEDDRRDIRVNRLAALSVRAQVHKCTSAQRAQATEARLHSSFHQVREDAADGAGLANCDGLSGDERSERRFQIVLGRLGPFPVRARHTDRRSGRDRPCGRLPSPPLPASRSRRSSSPATRRGPTRSSIRISCDARESDPLNPSAPDRRGRTSRGP